MKPPKKPNEWIKTVEKARNELRFSIAPPGRRSRGGENGHIGSVQADKYTLAPPPLAGGETRRRPLSLSAEAVEKRRSGSRPRSWPASRSSTISARRRKPARPSISWPPISAYLDTAAPPVKRVLSVGEELALGDWRAKPVVRDDVGDRPDLDSLGPGGPGLPRSETPFALPDQNQQTIALEDYRGRPVVLIFYLGYGCLHCAEQLKHIRSEGGALRAGGAFQSLAISTDLG